MPAGRPTIYGENILEGTRQYIAAANDDVEAKKVNLPTIEGLAFHLKISKDTIHVWRKEVGKEEFSYLIEELLAKQARALVNNGLAGTYNPTIAKVLLTKHGYREGVDQTTNDKDLPFTILITKDNADKSSESGL